MSDSEMKEVRFDLYCDLCEHSKLEGHEDPCNECLENACREGTTKPINFKKKESKGQ